jgi:hypothetical protein
MCRYGAFVPTKGVDEKRLPNTTVFSYAIPLQLKGIISSNAYGSADPELRSELRGRKV